MSIHTEQSEYLLVRPARYSVTTCELEQVGVLVKHCANKRLIRNPMLSTALAAVSSTYPTHLWIVRAGRTKGSSASSGNISVSASSSSSFFRGIVGKSTLLLSVEATRNL